MSLRSATAVLLIGILIVVSIVFVPMGFAEQPSRLGSRGAQESKGNDLIFEGEANVYLQMSERGERYVSFIPLGRDAEYGIALPFDLTANVTGGEAPELDEWHHLGGLVTLRFNASASVLSVTVLTADEETHRRTFVLDHERELDPAEFLKRTRAFLEYMRTGIYPLFDELEVELKGRQARHSEGPAASSHQFGSKSCSCQTPCCSCTVDCPAHALFATCTCSECTCTCTCTFPMY